MCFISSLPFLWWTISRVGNFQSRGNRQHFSESSIVRRCQNDAPNARVDWQPAEPVDPATGSRLTVPLVAFLAIASLVMIGYAALVFGPDLVDRNWLQQNSRNSRIVRGPNTN